MTDQERAIRAMRADAALERRRERALLELERRYASDLHLSATVLFAAIRWDEVQPDPQYSAARLVLMAAGFRA